MEKIAHYLIERMIDHQGTVEIYEATDERLGRKVRLEVLADSAGEDETARFEERVRAEARSGSTTGYVHELGRTREGRPYAVYTEARYTENREGGRPGSTSATAEEPTEPARGRLAGDSHRKPARGRRVLFMVGGILVLLAAAGVTLFLVSRPATERPLVALMPFTGESLPAEAAWMPFAAYESLLTALMRQQAMTVLGSGSIHYLSTAKDADKRAAAAGCVAVITGRLSKGAGGYSLALEARKVGGRSIFNKTYTLGPDGRLEALDEATRAMARAVGARVAQGSAARERYADLGPEAWKYATMGWKLYWNLSAIEDSYRGIDYFRKALALEPEELILYVDLHNFYADVIMRETDMTKRKAAEKSDASLIEAGLAIARAQEKSDIPDPAAYHLFLATEAFRRLDFKRAVVHQLEVVKYYPEDSFNLDLLGLYTGNAGDLEGSGAWFEKARAVDPYSLAVLNDECLWAVSARHYDLAIQLAKTAVDVQPEEGFLHAALGIGLVSAGRFAEARKAFEESLAHNGPFAIHALAYLDAAEGKTEKAKAELSRLQTDAEKADAISAFWIPAAYTRMGMFDEAFRTAEWGLRHKDGVLASFLTWEIFDALRNDPRYPALLELAKGGT